MFVYFFRTFAHLKGRQSNSGDEHNMLAGPPFDTEFNHPCDDEECDKASTPSTVGAVVDQEKSLTKKSFETHLGKEHGSWAKPLTGNKIPNDHNLEKSTSGAWCLAWNYTIRMLNPNTKNLIQCSKKWPDEGFGGKRCVKQLFEILVLLRYVQSACTDIRKRLNERYDIQKQKLRNMIGNSLIAASNEDKRKVHALFDEVEQLSTNYKRLTTDTQKIAHCIINDFFTNTIKSNTIKQERHQKIVQTFVDNPTVAQFEEICDRFARTNWRWFVHEQSQGLINYCELRAINLENLSDVDEPQAKRKRVNHSDQEKYRIKQKTGCVCVGLPIGVIRKCFFVGIARPCAMLIHEHRIPVSLDGQTALQTSLESDENRWGMCPECHQYKTHYIDPHIREHKNDLEFLSNYLSKYILPQKMIEQINLKVKMEEFPIRT